MNNVFGFVVGLLQAALSLIGFVQVHPELPQVQKDQAQVVAEQAITQATKTLSANQNTQKPAASSASSIGADGSLTVSPNSGSAPLTVAFTLSGLKAQSSYIVDFGDGQNTGLCDGESKCLSSPLYHEYKTAGTYTARLDLRPLHYNNLGNATLLAPYTVASVIVTVTGSQPLNISVPGMIKYTDTDFGFSFWYPSGWSIASTDLGKEHVSYNGGTVTKRLRIGISAGKELTVDEFNSPSSSISPGYVGSTGAGCRITYSFNAMQHQWLQSTSECDGPQTIAADISHNTMGGLHEFQGAAHLNPQTIIPLSAHNFIVVTYDGDVHYGSPPVDPFPLVNTILATDPSVATPVSAAEQTATIQAEKSAYSTN